MNEVERSLAYKPSRADIAAVQALARNRLPKISVVIPSLNQARYLPQTLESVLSQRYPRFEIFVADGGSTDGSAAILANYAKRHSGVLTYVSEPDAGQYHAVNKGLDRTDGQIVAWINSDDVYLPNAFWKVVAFFHFNRSALVAYGRNRYTNEDLDPVMDYPVDWSPLLREQRRRMMHFCLPPQPSLFFRRVATALFGKLASPILDYELWLRWQRDTQFWFIDDYLSLSRLHADAQTISQRGRLIEGICSIVHQYYLTVPYSWTLRRAYNETYGTLWTTGRVAPVTRVIRAKALWYWILYNLRWSPRALRRGVQMASSFARESLFGQT